MAFKPRSRTIKPSFFLSEDLANLPFEARLVFAGLWILADREGRLEDKPGQIKVYLMPYDQVDMDAILTNLTKKRLIERYQVNGQAVINIPTFLLHQKVHPHEAQSLLPAPQQDSSMSLNVMTSNDKSRQGLPVQEVEVEKEVVQEKEKSDKIPYSEIISDLNEILQLPPKRQFRDVESNRELIRARWKEGHRTEDFQYVHRVKVTSWFHDPKMRSFLRPSTLYRASKFPGYLAEPMPGESPLDGLSEKGRATFLAGLNVLKQQERQREKDNEKRLELQSDRE